MSSRSPRRRAHLAKTGKPSGRFRLSKRWRRVLAIFMALVAIFIVFFGGLVAYAALTLPDINKIGQLTGSIKIYDSSGKTLLAEVGNNGQARTSVTIDQIAPVMQQATLAAEDRNFYSEGAFNVPRVVKALIDDVVLRRPAEGASTITQQLAKQAFFGADAEKSALRKVKEALLASELDSKYSKQQILEKYLNITYYGENAYGIENAALRYFGKHAKDLNLMEASMLAGLPEAPSYNDPFQNIDAAYARMHYVLSGLVAMGQISQGDADAVDPLVGDTSPTSAQQQAQQHNQASLRAELNNGKAIGGAGIAPHFTQYVQDQLQQIFQASPEYLQGDLTVISTLNATYQQAADTAVANGVAKLKSGGANNGALLMIDAHTGAILAMVGSANFGDNSIAGQYNVVTGERRPGSSFKPYVYEEGFKSGAIKPDTVLQDTYAEAQKLGGVHDFDGQYLGNITAARSLLLSRNVSTEQAMELTGPQNVIDFAHEMGITSDLQDNASTAIGTSAVKMIDHVSAYGAFANGGHKVTAFGILRIQDSSGNVIRDFTTPADQGDPMTPAQAWSITQILRGYAKQWGMGFKWDTAGKSGTTDSFVDAWYMTYTPDWVVGTWAGHTDGSNPAETPMNNVFGTTEGKAIAVPFVNGLPKPSAFQPVSGALSDCNSSDSPVVQATGCPTPTPSPTPTETPTPSETPVVTPPPVTLLPSPTPKSTPAPTPPAPTPT